MDCSQAERLFDLYLDREITTIDYTSLRRHLAACPLCLDNWLATMNMGILLSALPAESPRPHVLSRIMVQLPRTRRSLSLRLTVWQTAAVVALACALAGVAYFSGARQMVAAAVENRYGEKVIVPRPGRPFVIPPGATIVGDLKVEGDAVVQGKVEGDLVVGGNLRSRGPGGFLARMGRALESCWRILTGR